jgi:hypothetical protein
MSLYSANDESKHKKTFASTLLRIKQLRLDFCLTCKNQIHQVEGNFSREAWDLCWCWIGEEIEKNRECVEIDLDPHYWNFCD